VIASPKSLSMLVLALALHAACAKPGTRRIYDVKARGTIDLSVAATDLPSKHCSAKTGDFGVAYWLGSHASTVRQIWIGPSRDSMGIQLDDRSIASATRVFTADSQWWGFWDNADSTLVIDLRCDVTCEVTMSVIRREHGSDRFAAACFERWVGGAEEIEERRAR